MQSSRWRLFLLSVVQGVAMAAPAAAPAAAGGANLPLCGSSQGVTSVDISTNPSPTTFISGHLSHLGAVTATGDKLVGTVHGTGVNNSGATSGINLVAITGGTGRFADASGSYTETDTGEVTSQVATIVSGPVTTTIRGRISLNKRYGPDR